MANEEDKVKREEEVDRTVEYLKEWLSEQEHLPQIKNDKLLYHFVIACACNREKATKKLDSYFTIRTLVPEFFDHRDPTAEEIKCSSECVSSGFLPGNTPDGCKVLFFSLLKTDPAYYELVPLLRRFYMFWDMHFMENEFNPSQGVYFLMRCKGSTLSHVMQLTIPILKRALFSIQDVYPIRVKGLLFVEVNAIVRVTVNTLIKPFMRPKLRKRLQIIGSPEELYQIIPKDMLPPELGGVGQTLSELSDLAHADLISKRTWLLTEGSHKSDEGKRKNKYSLIEPRCSIM